MVQQLWAAKVIRFVEERPCFVIDIREEEAFRKGHLPKAVHVNVEELEEGAVVLPKNIPLVIYCEQGVESQRIARLLSMKGYYVYNVVGGYEAYLNYLQNQEDNL